MSEMIERVAKAIKDAGGSLDMDGRMSHEDVWANCLDMARAAIQAMREPTEKMERSGSDAHMLNTKVDWPKTAGVIYQAMIDEALGW